MPLELHGFRVHIECDGKALPQYQVRQIDEKTVRCYIPSEAGKKFKVIASLVDPTSAPHDGFGAVLWAEGKRVLGACTLKHEILKIRHVRISTEEKRPFVFAAVQTTEEGLDTDMDASSIGLLEIGVRFAQQSEPRRTVQPRPALADTANAVTVLNERHKRAGFNVTGLGDSISRPAHTDITHWTFVGYKHNAMFQFYHQPLAMLQAAGIVPASQPVSARHAPPLPTTTPRKRPASLSANGEAGSSKRAKTGSIAARPTQHLPFDESAWASDGSDFESPSSLLRTDSETDAESGSEPERGPIQSTGSRRVSVPFARMHGSYAAPLLHPIEDSTARAGVVEDDMDVDEEEDVNARFIPSPSPHPTLPPPTQRADLKEKAGPSTLTREERHNSEEDVKPRLSAASTSRPLEDVKPSLQGLSCSNVVDRAAQLRAQIAAREFRVKRLAEEEQLALERAELAQLEAQTRAQQGKGKQRERGEAREVIDLSMED